MKQNGFAPREVFEQMLRYMPIATFDLVIEVLDAKGGSGVILVRRKIPPYLNKWALPGLRMLKGESIEQTLCRIAEQEVGIDIDVKGARILGQYVGKFSTENDRQDISTGYCVTARGDITLNQEHFTGYRLIRSAKEIPSDAGAMYRHYLNLYFQAR